MRPMAILPSASAGTRSLVLISTRSPTRPCSLLRLSVSPLIGRAMLPLLLKGMFAPLPVPARFTKSFPRGISVRPGQIRAESQDGVAMIPVALAMRHRYQELSMPIVIMAGTKDRVVKDGQAVRLHEEIPHSVLRLIPGVGHMVHYAVPDQVARAIEEAGKSATSGSTVTIVKRPLLSPQSTVRRNLAVPGLPKS